MFANECFLQDLPALAAKLSTCEKFVVTSLPVLGCKRLQATSFLPVPAKIAVSQTNVVVESARTCIRLRAASVNPPLRESFSGASTASTAAARIYMLRTLIQSSLLVAFCKIYPPQVSNLASRWKRMRDVHVCKRMFFARSARSSCQKFPNVGTL